MLNFKAVALMALFSMLAGASLIPAIGAIFDRDKGLDSAFSLAALVFTIVLCYFGVAFVMYAALNSSLGA